MIFVMKCLTGEEFCNRPIQSEKEVDVDKLPLWEVVSIGCRIPASKLFKALNSPDKNNKEEKIISEYFFYVKERLREENDDELIWAYKTVRSCGSQCDLYPIFGLVTAEYARRMIRFT